MRVIPFDEASACLPDDAALVKSLILEVAEAGPFILRDRVRKFEEAFAAWSGARFAVGLANADHATRLALDALDALGVEREDDAIAVATHSLDAASRAAITIRACEPESPFYAIGDAAVLTTDDERIATRVRMARNHGQDGVRRFHHTFTGWNARMDEIVAGHLHARLAIVDERIAARRAAVATYDSLLGFVGGYAYAVPHERPAELAADLRAHGVATRHDSESVFLPCHSRIDAATATRIGGLVLAFDGRVSGSACA